MKKQHIHLLIFVTFITFGLFAGAFMTFANQWHDEMPPITEWIQAPALPKRIADPALVYTNGLLIVTGGKGASNQPVADVWIASSDESDTISEWKASIYPLPHPLYGHAAVVVADNLFVIGGWDGGRRRTEIWRARIGSADLSTNWQVVSHVPDDITFFGATVVEQRLYLLGGWSGQSLDSIYYASIDASGAIGEWKRCPQKLPHPLYRLAASSSNGYIYVSGGYTKETNQRSEKIYYARVRENGELDSWHSRDIAPAREYHRSIVYDDSLVLLGGRDGSGKPVSKVESFVISPDGSLGDARSEQELPAPLYRFGAVAVNNHDTKFIVIAGGLGAGNSDYRKDVYHSNVVTPTPTPTPTSTLTPTPTNTPTPTSTPISTPTPLPQIDLTLMQSSHIITDSAPISPTLQLTYTISYLVTREEELEQITISNAVPSNVFLIRDSIVPTANITSTGNRTFLIWPFDVLSNTVPMTLSYQISQTIGDDLQIFNEGASARWHYRIDNAHIITGATRSFPLSFWIKPSIFYLPLIMH